jgi:DNA (cytosine-5)-methyltransferase 1
LFTGGGGLDLGLEDAGFEIRLCLDSNKAACDTIRLNRPKIPVIEKDICKVTGEDILRPTGLDVGETSLISGGPPCQSFSVLGQRKGLKDPRGGLIFEFVRIVDELKPKAFLLENVNGLTMAHSKRAAERIVDAFNEIGYKPTRRVLDAVNFGVPQYRRRVFFTGGRGVSIEAMPPVVYGDDKQATLLGRRLLHPRAVRWALQSPPPLEGLPNHVKRPHGDRVRKRYEKLRPGQRDKIDHTDRLEWDRPSGTVLVGSAAGGGRPHIHPEEPRVITVREAARLQTFPDDWVFAGSSTEQYRQIGNAVPVLLARAVGESLLQQLHPIRVEATVDS